MLLIQDLNFQMLTSHKTFANKGTTMNIWKNLQIYKHETNNGIISEQMKTKYDTKQNGLKTLNIKKNTFYYEIKIRVFKRHIWQH